MLLAQIKKKFKPTNQPSFTFLLQSRTSSGLTWETKCNFTTLLCALAQIFVVAERTRSDLAISPTRGMPLLQLIPVSLRQIPKTSPKVTKLSAESSTLPRA